MLSEPVLRPTVLSTATRSSTSSPRPSRTPARPTPSASGVPERDRLRNRQARSSVNIPLQGVPLRQLLTDRVGIPAFVDNDATVAALAEAHDDDLNLIAASLVMITVGTGVGGGIVIDGRIYRGATGAAPELGHIIVAADLTDGAPPRAARQPHHASLEYMAAGRALDRLGEARGLGDGTAVVAAARNGNPLRANACASSGNAWRRHRQRRQHLRPRARRHRRRGLGGRRAVARSGQGVGGPLHHPGRRHPDAHRAGALRPAGGRPRSRAARRPGAGTRRPSLQAEITKES